MSLPSGANTCTPLKPSPAHPAADQTLPSTSQRTPSDDPGDMFVNMSPGSSDGVRCDVDGNVWSAAGWAGEGFNGVHVFAPDGKLIGRIHIPETCANLCFGGAKKNRLFMAASQSLYAIYVETQGAQTG